MLDEENPLWLIPLIYPGASGAVINLFYTTITYDIYTDAIGNPYTV